MSRPCDLGQLMIVCPERCPNRGRPHQDIDLPRLLCGGAQFASLLPDIGRQDALVLAERLRAAFEATRHTVAAQPFTATVSVGAAMSDDASSDLAALLDVADQALYRAKALGRNRVELSTLSLGLSLQPLVMNGLRQR